ncbi:hypothetical protein SASPL_105659 [Salvia splendens]|uniref:Interactor of constitutive active ROP n=1 Tax=Salvia splendens TaxID=180675 RepID=A0A8X9AA67_SALSN|nr:hypothetical protein SASPL_105659 [Salvia splendens]
MQTATSRGLARKLRSAGSDSASSPNPITKPPNDPTSKAIRLPPPEKKRPGKPEAQDLKRTKEQLSSCESWKRRAEEAKKQLTAMAAELEESQNQLKEFSECEEARLQELRKISQERDKEWQSEMEAFHKHYSMDSAALASAMNEIQKLRMQLDNVTKSEAAQARHADSAHIEIQSLRFELTETLILVDRLKTQLNDSREFESYALDEVRRAEKQLEVVKTAENKLKLENDNVVGLYKSVLLDLDKSNGRVKSLEELVATLQSDRANISANSSPGDGDVEIAEMNTLKSGVDELRSALGDAERRNIDEYIQSTVEIQNAYQLVELTRSESSEKEAELVAKLRESRAQVEELRIKLVEMENAVQISSKLEKEEGDDAERATEEENEKLRKTETAKQSTGTSRLDAAQASNAELEAELRRLQVQCHQWRKAAEAAAAMLSTSKYGERRVSWDYHTITSRLSSPQSDDEEDDSPKKKNRNMLKKIGVLLKKGYK